SGEAIARYLRPGKYQLRVQHHAGGTGKMTVDVDGTERGKIIEIRVR
ncbi:MAG: hypothetical protein ACI841_003986, partial [Planctomycetota bacterium]